MWTIRETILGVFPCNIDWKSNHQDAYTGGTFLLASFRVDLKILGSNVFLFVLQTVFIICVCNNQLLDWLENELIYILSFVPGFASALPGLTAKLRLMKEKYLVASPPVTSDINVTYLFCLSLLWPLPFHTLFCILMFFG